MMSLTKEIIMSVEHEVEMLDNEMLLIYYNTHKQLNKQNPNFFFQFKIDKSFEEILNRGLEDERTM